MQYKIAIPQIGFDDDELYRFCMANPGLPVERDELGNILIMAPTGFESSYYNSSLLIEIGLWNRQKKAGKVTDSNGGYTLPDGSMRAPDVAWISNERINATTAEDRKKFVHVCPNFVVELLSESDSLKELQDKMEKYLANGVRLGWLIDLKRKQTHIYIPQTQVVIQSFDETLFGKDVLPELELNLTHLFAV